VRILFLHEVNYLEKPIFEMHEFPEHLSMEGHQIGFVHFAEGWTKKQIRRQGFSSTIQGRVLKDARIELFTPQQMSTGIASRLWMAVTAGGALRKAIHLFKPDLIFSYSVPTSGWQALRIAKKLSVPFVFRALDVSHMIRKTVFSGMVEIAENYIYRNADHVSANNLALARYCISRGSRPSGTSVELPPLDLTHFSQAAASRADVRAELGIPLSSKVVVYMGSFFYFSGLPEVIRDFAADQAKDTYLVLIGGGEQDKELRELVSNLGIENKVLFTGFVTYSELPHYLGIANVAINPMTPLVVSNFALPNKVLQYLASGLPVVSFSLSGLTEALPKNCDLVVATKEAGIWSEVIKLLERIDGANLGREQVNEELASQFSPASTIAAIEDLLKSVKERYRG
jgi:glycosyltransferase involved in cell wall biosynthesis